MATSKAQRAWDDLNARQQTYLAALFDVDQEQEEAQRALAARGQYSSAPARAWRRIHFNGADAPIVRRLRTAKVYDSGAGSTLAALRTRGLIETECVPGLLSDQVLVYLTRAGRAAVRAHRYGPPVRSAAPKWSELSEWMWKAMTLVAAAGADGLPADKLWNAAYRYLVQGELARGNRAYLDVITTYVRYQHRDFNGAFYSPPSFSTREVRRLHFTAEGRTHYGEHLAEYREFYPDIDAPDLPPTPPSNRPSTKGNDHE